jgi:hypothetical protein
MRGIFLVAITLVGYLTMSQPASAVRTGILAKRLQMQMASGAPVLPLDGRYFLGESFIEDHNWLILFCGQDVEKCAKIREELVEVVKSHGTPMDDMHFGEVDCMRHEAFCNSQNFEATPVAAVHYFKGTRQATWLPGKHSQASLATEFMTWFRVTFGDDAWSLYSLWDHVSPYLPSMHRIWERVFQYLPTIDPEYTPDLFCVLVFEIAVVSWVIVHGFELQIPHRAGLHCRC